MTARKFKFYKQIPSLQEYVLVDSERARIVILRRVGRRWEIEMHEDAGAVMLLESIHCQVALRQVYNKVSWFKPPPTDKRR